jgi:putative ABC transport system permease protein
MFDLDRWNEIISSLKGNIFRTALTALGIIWGILMLIIMLAAGNGINNAISYQFKDFATNSCFIWTNKTSMPYKGFKRNRWWQIEYADIESIKQNIPEVDLISPTVHVQSWRGGSQDVTYKNIKATFNIRGIHPSVYKIDPVNMQAGRFINELDIHNKRKVVVIGKKAKETLFLSNENPVGQFVQIQGTYFQVVGWFKSNHQEGWADWQNQWVLMPFPTLIRVYNYSNRVDFMAITSAENVPVSVIEEKVKKLLKRIHKIHPDDIAAVGSNNAEKEFQKMKGLFYVINIIIWSVGILTLFAGAMGVSNIMLVAVRERTKEIGIQRALGAKPSWIFMQIILESMSLTFVAGLVGLVTGIALVGLVENIESPTFRNPEVDLKVALLALAVISFTGLLSGLLPARKAIKIKPVQALKFSL